MKFAYYFTLILTALCISSCDAINLLEIKNFCKTLPFSINYASVKYLSYNSLTKPLEVAHKHQALIFSTLGLVTLGIAALIHFKSCHSFGNQQKSSSFNSDMPKKSFKETLNLPTTDFPIGANAKTETSLDNLNTTKHYFISPTRYFLLSEQFNENHRYGIALFDTKEGFIEKIAINDDNKTALEHYLNLAQEFQGEKN